MTAHPAADTPCAEDLCQGVATAVLTYLRERVPGQRSVTPRGAADGRAGPARGRGRPRMLESVDSGSEVGSSTSCPRHRLAGIVRVPTTTPSSGPTRQSGEDVAADDRGRGVELVSVGIFSWALLEPAPGATTSDWLEPGVLDLLHGAGSPSTWRPPPRPHPPGWPGRHPETLPVDREGGEVARLPAGLLPQLARCTAGASWRWSSTLAERFGPSTRARAVARRQRVGCHNARCYCDRCAAAFRAGCTALRRRRGAQRRVGTEFWGQRYYGLGRRPAAPR